MYSTPVLNRALLGLPKRAESTARENLIQTFVDVGPLFPLLSNADHQVLFGRRGTGKTHALAYLAAQREKEGDAVAVVDLRNIGSSAGIYADETVPLSERATRLLVDTLVTIHDALVIYFVANAEQLNLAETGPLLDDIAQAITEVRVVGEVSREFKTEAAESNKENSGLKTSFAKGIPNLTFSLSDEAAHSQKEETIVRRKGNESLYVNFGNAGSAFKNLVAKIGNRKIWILLDEWSSVPIKLQPYLADLIRRSLFPIPGFVVKIAAIEHRSEFQIRFERNDYVGIELGADASADVNLDDFMVFDNDPDRAKEFFIDLIGRHVDAVLSQGENHDSSASPRTIVQEIFTEKRSLEEFVRACEGVPRDAINILALAAQRALSSPISVSHIRIAARNWYQRDKEKSASTDSAAHQLLQTIIDQVIGTRKARAFLLKSNIKNLLIDSLYDSRVLHVLKRGVSTHDQPGVRFDVYKLDYGCYVDLLTTQRSPMGLLPLDDGDFIEVPPDDYRSIRRAILNL